MSISGDHEIDRGMDAPSESQKPTAPDRPRYWKPFVAAAVFIAIAIAGYFIFARPLNNATIVVMPARSQAQVAAPPPSSTSATVAQGAPQLPAEAESDTPSEVGVEVSTIFVDAFLAYPTATRIGYLQHAFSCSDTSCGYSQAVGQLQQVRIFTDNEKVNVVSNDVGSTGGDVVAGAMAVDMGGAAFKLQFAADWVASAQEWLITSITWSSGPAN